MRRPPSTRSMLFALLGTLVAVACGGDDREVRSEAGPPSAAGAQLDSASIARLAERFPRLGADPLPEPRPSSRASPDDPPDLPGAILETVQGEATFYADRFEGRRTASGIPFRQNQMVAAHRGYPFGTILRVTNLRNERSVNVRVVDRGPFGATAKARRTIIDLSRRAAERLGYVRQGRTPVRVEVLEWGRGLRT